MSTECVISMRIAKPFKGYDGPAVFDLQVVSLEEAIHVKKYMDDHPKFIFCMYEHENNMEVPYYNIQIKILTQEEDIISTKILIQNVGSISSVPIYEQVKTYMETDGY
jgi:hypothetical protein